ncbi:MAG: IPT/TIG domain-containing protein [Prevotellaceae bacterium]|jgi:DNA-binding beta-propeller fold protein YncE|nr:IPT/TIG domain-containing protein [Prevotellaceae bacterium]
MKHPYLTDARIYEDPTLPYLAERSRGRSLFRIKGGWNLVVPALFLLICLTQCKDEKEAVAVHDPNLPVEITKFTPDSGGSATQILIYGSNFGSDTSQIRLTFNGNRAPLIGCNGSVIYALVPSGQLPPGLCDMKLQVGAQEISIGQFNYITHYVISTLCGFTDQDGNSGFVNGPINEAQFINPIRLAFDGNKNIYVTDQMNGIRRIDAAHTTVTTPLMHGNGADEFRTVSFTQTYDTMIVAIYAWEVSLGLIVLTSRNDFSTFDRVVYSTQTCDGGAFHPVHYDYYFNSMIAGTMYKVTNRSTLPWIYEDAFRIGGFTEALIQFAPSGDFAYITSAYNNYILKASYDWDKRTLNPPVAFVGVADNPDYLDGSLTNARVRGPRQGAFDEEGNFYFCDTGNHCIRKMTREGVVSTFAGRPEESGYVDGELREAQFKGPEGILYDKDTKTFYIADSGNRRIRKISYE